MILKVCLIYFEFVRSLRTGDFKTYKLAINSILPYMFANDSVHYSRWLTIHYSDMIVLKTSSPDVYEQFQKGNFVLHESSRRYSGIALDQAHEHNNAIIKSEGGAIGITESPSALLRWMTAGPEICQITKDYETNKAKNSLNHHEDIPANQRNFFKDMQSLTDCMYEVGNPFSEETDELFTLVSKKVTNSKDLYSFEKKGKEQFDHYIANLQNLNAPIKRNNFNIFGNIVKKHQNA